jgi:cation diffusion facilitator family transporter
MNQTWAQRLTPRRLLLASVVVALVTIALKTVAWWVTDSVSLLSDAMESLVNLAGATFGLWMVTIAARPADDDHPYGHHKAEYFSSGFEGVLIIAAALAIIWAAGNRFLNPVALEQINWGMGLTVVSSALNGLLAWVMFRSAKVHRSVALEGDARHLVTDVWTSAGVLVGLALVLLTDWLWVDPLVAVFVAMNILREGVRLVWQASQGLMDEAVEPEVLRTIEHTLHDSVAHNPDVRFDDLFTRKAGQRCFLDVHMHVPGSWTLTKAATLRDQVEKALMQAVPGLRPTIQLLPDHMEAHFIVQEEHKR